MTRLLVAAVIVLSATRAQAADVKLEILSDPIGATLYEGDESSLKSFGSIDA